MEGTDEGFQLVSRGLGFKNIGFLVVNQDPYHYCKVQKYYQLVKPVVKVSKKARTRSQAENHVVSKKLWVKAGMAGFLAAD